eukprot:scaffold111812_cov36-Tisochrysis_lutea.AAC.3
MRACSRSLHTYRAYGQVPWLSASSAPSGGGSLAPLGACCLTMHRVILTTTRSRPLQPHRRPPHRRVRLLIGPAQHAARRALVGACAPLLWL